MQIYCMNTTHGFSLLELLVVMAIAAILILISYPSYIDLLVKGRRHQAQIDLLYMASQLEQFYTIQNTYQGATLEILGVRPYSDGHYYQLNIQATTDSSYVLTAIPLEQQAVKDKKCGELSLNELGERGSLSQPENCWS